MHLNQSWKWEWKTPKGRSSRSFRTFPPLIKSHIITEIGGVAGSRLNFPPPPQMNYESEDYIVTYYTLNCSARVELRKHFWMSSRRRRKNFTRFWNCEFFISSTLFFLLLMCHFPSVHLLFINIRFLFVSNTGREGCYFYSVQYKTEGSRWINKSLKGSLFSLGPLEKRKRKKQKNKIEANLQVTFSTEGTEEEDIYDNISSFFSSLVYQF